MSSVAGLNNMPTLAFTQGPNTYLQIAHNASLNPASQSAIIVLKRDSDNTSEIISKFVGDGGIYYGYVTEWYAGSYRMYWNNGNSDYIATNTSIGQYAILETVYNQQTMRNYVNGVLSGSINKTYALGANSVPLYIAGSYYGLNGHIAEVLLYNRGITDLERQAIEVYLYQKYGVGNIQTATAPTITLTSGESGAQQYATLSAATGASIYYTLDGNTPTTGSALYAGQFSITTSCTLKAIAVESGKAISSVTSRTILIDPSAAAVPMSGMAVWLRADVGVTKDANSKVSVWQDQSGGGHDASMTNTTAQPVWMASVVNGRPVVRFDGVNDYLTTSYNWPGGTELSLFVVTKGGNYQSLIRAQDGDYVVYPWSNGATFILSSDGGTGNGVSSGLVASEWNLGSAIYKTGETMSTYRNGTLVGSRTAGTNTLPSKPLMIGSYLGSSEFLNADVAEVILYNRALSTQERQNVEAYLTHKYLDADSDGNGISDTWEMQYFGRVGVNADGDEDKDGLTNLQEYQQGSDPTQYYNGLTPTLRIVSGDGQTAPSGSYAPQALSVQVVNASNQILSNAPIRFRVTSTVSDGKLSRVGAMGAVTADAIDLKTQIDGYGTVYAKLPITVADMTIEASAVGISATPVTFTLHANSGTVATPSITADLDYFSITRTLTIACATSGADIRYTLDGNAPTLSSATVANGGTVTTTGRTLIRVKAFKTGYTPSGEKTMLLVSQPNLLQLAAHGHYSMIKNAAGEVWNWGDNSCGQLGQAVGITSQSTPIQLGNPAKAALITVGDYHAAGILSTTNSSAWSVGANWFGQLGDGTATSTSSAVAVQTLTSVTAIAAGEYHTLAVTSDKTVWAWGVNWYGGLGDGTNSQRTSPVLITNLTNVSAIAAGGVHSLALKGDGTVWAWGGNLYGQLGLGTTTDRNTPAQISALNSITAIASGSVHNLALRSDGTVWAWGSNDYGQLGDGTTTQRIVPVQVMINATTALSGVRSIAVGRSHSFAITSDGKLWVWGYNGTGQLGNNTTTNQPYAITLTAPTLFTNVVLVAGGYNHSLAMTADGAVWAWGDNSLGQLGTGDTTNHLVPTKIDFATDSDGDGLSDLYEIIHGYDPLAVDSNGDGIGDAASEAMGIDPTNPDVDGDGISNEQELLRGTNPLVKEIAPVATPGDTEAPVILLHRPVNATPQTPQP